MKYSVEEVLAIYTKVLSDVEHDLVHQIKHSKDAGEKHVAMLRVFDLVSRGINHKLEEATNGQ